MKKIISIIFCILFLMPMVLADGMVIEPYPGGWHYADENTQLAVINYQNNLEKMIISINTDAEKGAVWLFPIPAAPEDVVIDVVDTFPNLFGSNIIDFAERGVDDVIESSKYTLIYPIFRPRYLYTSKAGEVLESAISAEIETGSKVIIHETIEKYGITTQLLSSNSATDLYVYLRNKGLEVNFQSITPLREYIGNDYTFVVSWISEEKETEKEITPYKPRRMPYYGRQLGTLVIFPTEKPYFPLMPTSVYGSKEIPLRIDLLGFWTPDIYEEIETFTETNYLMKPSGDYPFYNELREFYGQSSEIPNYFTRVQINSPSKFFKEDLYFTQDRPSNVGYAVLLDNVFYGKYHNTRFLTVILFIAILSVISSTIMGLILFPKQWKKFSFLGLANILSIIGLIVALIFIKTKSIDKELNKKLRFEGYLAISKSWKKIIFLAGFIILFIGLGTLIGWLLKLPF